jgi:hypothetical protein
MAQLDSVKLNYAREFAKLSLWYVHKRLDEADEDFETVVNTRVNIYRNTVLYDFKHHPSQDDVGAEWKAVLERLREVFERCADEPSTARLEEEGLDILWPYLQGHVARGGTPVPPLAERPYECWSHDYRNERCNIHIDNLYRPASPLSERRIHFAASLIRLLHDSRAQRADIEVVRCGSWLNSLGAFLELFPEGWRRSATKSGEAYYTLGHWGQFMDRCGDFNAHNGALFRQRGAFPFACVSCESPLVDVLEHLKENFPAAVEYNGRREA